MKERATEIVAITVPVLIEAVAVIMFIGIAVVWISIKGAQV